MTKTTDAAKKPERGLKLERGIDAPIARVFEAWAKPEQVAKWFAPSPLPLEVTKMDFKSDGTFEMCRVWPAARRATRRGPA